MGGYDEIDRLHDLGVLGDVSANKGCRASVLGDLRDDIRTFLFATASDDDFRARFCKGQRCSFADTGGASGHKHYLLV